MTAHASDYTWINEHWRELVEAYCLTMVEGISAEELLRRIDAGPIRTVTGLSAVLEAADEFEDGGYDEDGDGDEDREAEGDEGEEDESDDEDGMFIAATEIGGWALAVESYGHLGVSREVIAALSRGTRLVSHFRNVNAADHFYWHEDGRERLHFEPLFARERQGSDAEAAAEAMRLAGFDLSAGEEHDHTLHTEAAFAFAEHLTGVRLTPELLEAAVFRCGAAPEPR